jgi:iron complex transport system substrate-binding protein
MRTQPEPTPTRRGTTRRRRVAVAVVAAVALLAVSACGDDGSDGAEGTSASGSGSTGDGDGAAAFPREVEHALGTTEIETEPERVVSVGYTEHDALLALGVTPVAVTEWYGEQPFATWPWAQDELGDAEPEVLTTTDGFNYERIAELDPDLIIGTNAGLDDESYELLSQIAPTIAHPAGAETYFSPWDDQAELIGQALGREDEMDAIVSDVRDQFRAAAEEHPEFEGQQIVFLQNAIYDGRAIAYQDGLSTHFLTDLGFTVPDELDPFVREGEQAYIPVERLDVLDVADVLLWATESPDDRTALEAQPIFRRLEEVEDGRVVFTDGVTAGAIYFTSVLSLPFVLDQLVPALASTLAGEGPAQTTAPS